MLSAVRWMLAKVLSPIWTTAEGDGDGTFTGDPDVGEVRHLQGVVVTQLCLDHGLIDDNIYFTSLDVFGGMPLKEGDSVNCIAIRDGAQGGWKAIRVEKVTYSWEDTLQGGPEADIKPLHLLIGTVTSVDGNGGFINKTTFFPHSSLTQGYMPMRGDWVQAKYFITPGQLTTEAQSVAPLRYCRLDEVRVSSLYGKNGVVDESVFFCLDSLMLPANYQPLLGHLVNVVVVESSQSLYSWRALCMAPCPQGMAPSAPISKPEIEIENLVENKEGLDVTDFGQYGHLMFGEKRGLVFWIQNNGSQLHSLKCCKFAGWDPQEQFTLIKVGEPAPPRQEKQQKSAPQTSETQASGSKQTDNEVKLKDVSPIGRKWMKGVDIPAGERLPILVECLGKSLGTCTELLLLQFCSFTIGRRLEVRVGCVEENLLEPSGPFISPGPKPIPKLPSQVITVPAPKIPPRLLNRQLPSFLGSYPVPKFLRDCVEAQRDVLVVQPCLGEVLSPSNMISRFSTLLWLEELHAEKELKEYTIYGAILKKGGTYLHLEIVGLAEGRPSLNIGDRILLRTSLDGCAVVEYTCYVAEVVDETVSLKVNPNFHNKYNGEPFNVEFCLDRLTLRRCHYAVQQVPHLEKILFPTILHHQPPQWTGTWMEESELNKIPTMEDGEESRMSSEMQSKATQTKDNGPPSRPLPSEGHFFNASLNPTQREAVRRILTGECRPIPYVLFGPPGTGKTITLIEAILQVYHFLPGSRVLVCTPSNSAADLIAVRLHDSGFLRGESVVRVNASSRQEESIPEVLKSYSMAGENIRQACFYRIVVSTCSSAAMFYSIGIQVGHFTHVFLDEAGQATEPESLIPISYVSGRDGQIVLAGDPCQLGPVVKSKLASAFGLGMSLLERLMANPLYNRHENGYDPKLVTKLIFNYRAHEALLTLPSRLFYKGELCVRAPKVVVESLCLWKKLPKKGFPLLFHGVRGTEMREGTNPSWFNAVEAVQVMLYCCQLAKKLYNPVDTTDIGIISPYKKQCEKIRILLARAGLSGIKVGSVEEFQGQEFLVIIISTVRSNESALTSDVQSALGFLTNPKRFNVAITRAKALLIVVGNPHVLIQDPCFRALLDYCFNNGAFLGCNAPSSLRDSNQSLSEKMSA